MNIPEIGTTCAYQFATKFSSLNGIYTLAEVLTYTEAVAENVDFVNNLYVPAGLTSSNFSADASNYASDSVLYLKPADGSTGTPIYMPSSQLTMIPDPMIGCYNNLAIGISLGLFAEADELAWIISELNQLITGATGVSNPVKLYSLGVTHMHIVDYQALVATRTAAQIPISTLYQQLQEQIALTTAAQNLNRYYEATLIALNNA